MSRSIRVLVALAVGLAGVLSAPAIAADNSTLPVCGSCATSEVFANKDIGGVKFPKHILHNGSGTEIGTSAAELFVGGRGTAGSAAGGVLTVQGVASMTPLFMQSATVPVSTMNSASANSGVNAALSGVFDDTSPTAITENSFGFLRMSANRNLYGTIRDAAGNERGVNVDASNRLSVTGPVFGPTANGAAAANPPVLIGGTANGAATGNVGNWKVDSAGTGFIDCVSGGTLCTALANGVQTAGSAVGTQLIAWGINVAGNARQPTGSNPTGSSYAVHQDLIGINGTTPSVNSGNKDAGTQRVVLATDQPTMTNPQPVTPAATESHLGEVGGNQIRVDVAQTVTASSAYTSGNAVGGKMTISGAARVSGSLGAAGTGGILQQVVANSKSVQTAQIDVFIFNSDPSSSTCTDKTAFVLATADFDKVIGVASIPGTAANNSGWFSGGTGSVGQANNLAMAFDLASATTLYACAVVRGTPTFTATSDISFKYQILRN